MRTVAIVDDEPIVRMDLRDMLEEIGFSVAGEADDGFDAIELCRETSPDVVLMDVKMPVFDGISAARTIMSESLAGCVILLTAYSDPEIIRKATQADVSGYLVKPISKEELLPTIEVALSQSRKLKESRDRARAAELKLKEDRLIHRAQAILAGREGISESEAYRRMRSLAMDKRIPVARIAGQIVSQEDQESEIDRLKQFLMKEKGMSEDRAYRYIANYGKNHSCSTKEAASRMLRSMKASEDNPC